MEDDINKNGTQPQKKMEDDLKKTRNNTSTKKGRPP